MAGKVWLVGAGPGDPELMTVRGRDALAEAEVVVLDDATSREFLELVPEGVEVLNVGLQPLLHPISLNEVTNVMVARAREGKRVVRLLGGDPFVFGPGVREAEALAGAGVTFEIVPGVTATVASPAYAGIPILHPDLARAYAVLTGDAVSTAPESLVDWDRVATAVDTLVFAAAAENLAALSQRLIASGRPAQTPAAVVSWGTHARQRTVVGRLDEIAALVAKAGVRPPAITVVGEVVRLREQLRWYDDRPLFGRRVLLTRTRGGASDIRRQLQAAGADVIELPTHEIVDLVAPEIIGRVADALTDGQYGWVIFSSGRAVELFFRHLATMGRDARALHATQVVAAGPRTTDALAVHGIIPDVLVESPTAEGVLDQLHGRDLSRRRVLLPRAEESQQDLLRGLRRAGAEVEDVPLYVSSIPREPNREALSQLRRGEIDIVVFPASAAVTNLIGMLGDGGDALKRVTVGCVGPITVEVARRAGLRVDAVAQPATPAGLIRALGEQAKRAGHAQDAASPPVGEHA